MRIVRTRQNIRESLVLAMAGLIIGVAPGADLVTLGALEVWTRKTDMPTARLGLATSVVRGKIYAIGGYTAAGNPGLKTVEEYDPVTDTWTSKAYMPTGRRWLAASVVHGKIYAIGGFANNGAPGLSAVEMYDPETDMWTRKADMPTPRKFLSASTVDGKIYAIGGSSSSSGLPALATVEAYDPQTDIWTRKVNMPTARIMLSSGVVGGKIYVMGGTQSPSSGFSTVEEYDPATDTWTRKADMLMAVAGVSVSSSNGTVYAIGGGLYSGGPTVSFLDAYDPKTDTWTRKAHMPTARWVLATSVVNGRVYAIGGSETTVTPHPGIAAVEEYDPNPLVVDFNGDGIVDCADICMMTEHWLTNEPSYDIAPPPFGDGIVDAQDLIMLSEYLMKEVDEPTLAAHWALDEAEGGIAYDSASANDGIVLGEPTWQPTSGQVAGALELDGVDDYVSTFPVLNPAEGVFSIFVWIKGGLPGQVIVSQEVAANWLMIDAANGALRTHLRTPATTGRGANPPGPPLISQTVITDGYWHRVGFVWDGGNRILYVDGVEVASDTAVDLESAVGGLYIGVGSGLEPGTFWSGLIDDVRIYNRAVSP